MKKIVKATRKATTVFPKPDLRISVDEIRVFATSPMGPVIFKQPFSSVMLKPGDSLQLTWNYEGVAGEPL